MAGGSEGSKEKQPCTQGKHCQGGPRQPVNPRWRVVGMGSDGGTGGKEKRGSSKLFECLSHTFTSD